ncbi:MAG: hypothetical protein K2N24_05895, partial [Lachnospiraceae bacterium]|nr:hypothetical protein [Lachnospiraceae bacterium]
MRKIIGAAISTVLGLGLLLNPWTTLNQAYGVDAPIAINETNFPDEVFRNYVKDNFDEDGNSELSVSELENVTN